MKKIISFFLMICIIQVIMAQPFTSGLKFDDAAYAKTPLKKQSKSFLPTKVSLKDYCPTPQLQQGTTCVGWAIGYAACTISEAVTKNIKDKEILNKKATSSTYVYFHGKSGKSSHCKELVNIDEALSKLKGKIIPRHQAFGNNCGQEENLASFTEGVCITEFSKLFENGTDAKQKLYQIKQVLAANKPVVVAISYHKSFFHAKEVWSGVQDDDDYDSGHAICVVGYDDNYYSNGDGVVEIMNSWGTNWGKDGFTKIRYDDFAGILRYGYEFTINTKHNETIEDLSTPKGKVNVSKSSIEVEANEVSIPFFNSSIELKFENGSIIPLTNLLSSNRDSSSKGLNPVKRTLVPSTSVNANYKTSQSYQTGTKFQVFVDYNEPIYLYVLGSDLTGQVNKIFPVDEQMSPYLSSPAAQIVLPDEKYVIEMDKTKGKDYLIFIYSHIQLPIDDLLKQWNTQSGTAMDKMVKKFDSSLQKIDSIRLSTNQIVFRTAFDLKNIILLALEMDHE